MSRFREWHGTLSNIYVRLSDAGIKDKDLSDIAKKKINQFYPEKKDGSSYTDRILYVRKNYSKFCQFLQNNLK